MHWQCKLHACFLSLSFELRFALFTFSPFHRFTTTATTTTTTTTTATTTTTTSAAAADAATAADADAAIASKADMRKTKNDSFPLALEHAVTWP